jgi:hypothetical protein
MKVIDIDRLTLIDNHIHYIKEYEGSAVLMDKLARIIRNNIKFSIEYKPMGDPDIKVNFIDSPICPTSELIPKLKEKIQKLDQNGTLAALYTKK